MLIEHLEREFAQRKSRNPAYSLRAFAKSLGFSAGSLSNIMNKKRPISLKSAQRLFKSLHMDPHTRLILSEALSGAQGQSPEHYLDISALSEEVVGDWRYFAVLSILQTKGPHDPKHIGARLGLHTLEVQGLLGNLVALRLVEKKALGYVARAKNWTSTHDVLIPTLRKVHRQWIEKSIGAIEEQSVETRDFSGMTMAIDPKKIPEAKLMIKSFRRKLCQFLESENQKKVYRLNIQLFSIEKEG